MTDAIDILKHSVTYDNYDRAATPLNSVLFFGVQQPAQSATPGLPPYYSKVRDYVLASTPLWDDTWSGALNKQMTRQVAAGWEVKDTQDSNVRVNRASEMLHTADGTGWTSFAPRNLMDYLTTDNGAFIEVIRASSAAGSKILGIAHLDSLRCTRTNDLAIPVLYRDFKGREHEMQAHQVLHLVDQPSSRVELNGVGLCAASRAFRSIVKLMTVETYFREKVTGDRILAIHLISGVTAKQIQSAVDQVREDKLSKGYVVYRGAVTIPTMDMATAPNLVTIPLAEIPDGFDVEKERKAAKLNMANALGLAFNDLEPLSHQGFGQGKQSEVLDEAAAQGGPAALWRKQIEFVMSRYVLPETTTFYISTNDLSEQKKKAEVSGMRATERAARITAGELSPSDARQLAADAGDLPQEMLGTPDATPGGSIDDTEKPVTIQDVMLNLHNNRTLQAAPVVTPTSPIATTKEHADMHDEAARLFDEEILAAKKLVKRVKVKQ
jgi:hypothetical protein